VIESGLLARALIFSAIPALLLGPLIAVELGRLGISGVWLQNSSMISWRDKVLTPRVHTRRAGCPDEIAQTIIFPVFGLG
jgi:hypothetical protein